MLNRMDLIDGYVEFCLDQWGEIERNFNTNRSQNRWNLPLVALKLFIQRGPMTLGRPFYKWEKPFLKDALVIMTENLHDMWMMFRRDSEYAGAILRHDEWLSWLKETRRQPPYDYNSLYSSFASAELLMLISEGKVKKKKVF